MTRLGRFTRQLRARIWKVPVEREVDAELAYHLEMRTAENIAAGMDPGAAREAALRRFGDVAQIASTCRTLGEERDRAMELTDRIAELRQDATYAARHLRANPVFAVVAALTIALGIGTSTTIFGIVDAVLLRPLPFREPDRLVRVWEANPTIDRFGVSEPNYLDWRARARSFTELAAYAGTVTSLTGGGDPERLRGAVATPALFRVLGVAPALGRALVDDDARPGDVRRVVVLSDALWRRSFGADARAVGRSITLDGRAYEIVGVMPAGFDFPGRRELWLPYAPSTEASRGNHILSVVGRLKPGVAVAAATTELRGIAGELSRQYPQSNADWGVTVASVADWIVGPELRTRVLVLLAAVGLLLLMACVNVANLLLARATARQRDMGLRAALGAGRGRLARQLLTESLVLAASGAAVGIALAFVLVPALRGAAADTVPRLDEMRVDWRVLAFGVGASALTGLLFGLAPAVQASRTNLATLLRGGGRVAAASGARSALGALIVGSVALATLLLVGAGLIGGSFVRLMRVDPGFDPGGVLTAQLVLPDARYGDEARRDVFWSEVVRRLSMLPGVRAAGATNVAPFSGGSTSTPFTVPGRADAGAYRQADWRAVTPGYFAALGIRLKRGRLVAESDARDAPTVIVVSEAMAARVWPGEDPIGRQVLAQGNKDPWTVVGVVGDIRDGTLEAEPREMMYLSYHQNAWGSMWLTLRMRGDPMRAADAVRREIWAIDRALPVAEVQPLERLVADAAAQPRLTSLVFALFAGAALVLAVVGVYGIVAYGVAQQTREIGVRLALGAGRSRILARVVGHGLRLALAGTALGAVAALALSRYLTGILYDVAPTDAATYAAVVVVLATAAALASALPATAAARLDPVRALRNPGS
ncbi:permease (plasmid) [Gemmatirosa kalamazoonensis]|uniref:Permease n=1 Tax=Gemmatirosa kalamazoonensis TaxID=861299 RepID=W0RS24_9BACT|nr:ABC transporter permease [Gemmatirosa kalamazoonensis]AHG93247.1 permease [Gemmatirosa kalamazoonensis]